MCFVDTYTRILSNRQCRQVKEFTSTEQLRYWLAPPFDFGDGKAPAPAPVAPKPKRSLGSGVCSVDSYGVCEKYVH